MIRKWSQNPWLRVWHRICSSRTFLSINRLRLERKKHPTNFYERLWGIRVIFRVVRFFAATLFFSVLHSSILLLPSRLLTSANDGWFDWLMKPVRKVETSRGNIFFHDTHRHSHTQDRSPSVFWKTNSIVWRGSVSLDDGIAKKQAERDENWFKTTPKHFPRILVLSIDWEYQRHFFRWRRIDNSQCVFFIRVEYIGSDEIIDVIEFGSDSVRNFASDS